MAAQNSDTSGCGDSKSRGSSNTEMEKTGMILKAVALLMVTEVATEKVRVIEPALVVVVVVAA